MDIDERHALLLVVAGKNARDREQSWSMGALAASSRTELPRYRI
jgi:hypothetical protein